jgi:cellulose biosynthesis protein BcsQ
LLGKVLIPILIGDVALSIDWKAIVGTIQHEVFRGDIHRLLAAIGARFGLTLAPIGTTAVVIAVLGAKGGVGKTTIAIRLSELLVESNYNVLLVDLDVGASGSTTLLRMRSQNRSAAGSVHEMLAARAAGQDLSTFGVKPLDVTPKYLAAAGAGRLFLLPAVPVSSPRRAPTIDLLRQIDPALSVDGLLPVLDAMLLAATVQLPPIGVLILDCGAEGPEFNALVTAAHEKAALTYVVAQPDPICRENIGHVASMMEFATSRESLRKMRVIVNRVVSTQHESFARSQFTDFQVAAVVPENRDLFEDVQAGRLDYRYGYDAISRSLAKGLESDREVFGGRAPDEKKLWATPLAEMLTTVDLHAVLLRSLGGRKLLFRSGLPLVLALSLMTYGCWNIWLVAQLGDISETHTQYAATQLRSEVFSAFVTGLALFGFGIYHATDFVRRWRFCETLRRATVDSSTRTEQLLLDMTASPSSFHLITWLETAIETQSRDKFLSRKQATAGDGPAR